EVIEVEEVDVLEMTDDERGDEPVIVEKKKPKKQPALVGAAPEATRSTIEPSDSKQATIVDMAAMHDPTPAPDANDPPKPRKRLANGTKADAAKEETSVVAAVPPPPPQPTAAPGDGPVIVEPRFKHADKATMAAKEKAAEADRPFI